MYYYRGYAIIQIDVNEFVAKSNRGQLIYKGSSYNSVADYLDDFIDNKVNS